MEMDEKKVAGAEGAQAGVKQPMEAPTMEVLRFGDKELVTVCGTDPNGNYDYSIHDE